VQLGFLGVLLVALWLRRGGGHPWAATIILGALLGGAAHLVATATSLLVFLSIADAVPPEFRGTGLSDGMKMLLMVQGLGGCGVVGLWLTLGLGALPRTG